MNNEEKDNVIVEEKSLEDLVTEVLNEGLFDRMGARWQGFKSGAKTVASNVAKGVKGVATGGDVQYDDPSKSSNKAKLNSLVDSFKTDLDITIPEWRKSNATLAKELDMLLNPTSPVNLPSLKRGQIVTPKSGGKLNPKQQYKVMGDTSSIGPTVSPVDNNGNPIVDPVSQKAKMIKISRKRDINESQKFQDMIADISDVKKL